MRLNIKFLRYREHILLPLQRTIR